MDQGMIQGRANMFGLRALEALPPEGLRSQNEDIVQGDGSWASGAEEIRRRSSRTTWQIAQLSDNIRLGMAVVGDWVRLHVQMVEEDPDLAEPALLEMAQALQYIGSNLRDLAGATQELSELSGALMATFEDICPREG